MKRSHSYRFHRSKKKFSNDSDDIDDSHFYYRISYSHLSDGFSLLELLVTITLTFLLFSFLFPLIIKLEKRLEPLIHEQSQQEEFCLTKLQEDWSHALLLPRYTPPLLPLDSTELSTSSSYQDCLLLLKESPPTPLSKKFLSLSDSSAAISHCRKKLFWVSYFLLPEKRTTPCSYALYRIPLPLSTESKNRLATHDASFEEEKKEAFCQLPHYHPLLTHLSYFRISFLQKDTDTPLLSFAFRRHLSKRQSHTPDEEKVILLTKDL